MRTSREQVGCFSSQDSKLTRQADLIPEVPCFGDLAALHATAGHSLNFQFAVCGGNSQAIAGVSSGDGPAGEGGVALLHDLVEHDFGVGASGAHGLMEALEVAG